MKTNKTVAVTLTGYERDVMFHIVDKVLTDDHVEKIAKETNSTVDEVLNVLDDFTKMI